MDTHFAIVLEHFDGSASALAAAVGGNVKRQNVEYWITTGRVPVAHRPAVERATEGLVTCEQLSLGDGAQWARIPDKSWPWNKKGRPTHDIARVAA